MHENLIVFLSIFVTLSICMGLASFSMKSFGSLMRGNFLHQLCGVVAPESAPACGTYTERRIAPSMERKRGNNKFGSKAREFRRKLDAS